MPLNENDLSYLIDIVDCIMDIDEFTGSIYYSDFEKDKMRKLAVERQLEVIGQAANKISKETQDSIQNVPWGNIFFYFFYTLQFPLIIPARMFLIYSIFFPPVSHHNHGLIYFSIR
ncbi:hypothetical protein AGMMS50230_01080 [Spirochaetia bacterium]|nr:hypothetical protein AGMMS50230_01080 [Spirochaetia bacterium]